MAETALPDVLGRAFSEAIRLGQGQASLPHILLALLDERQPSVARDSLRALGVRRETIELEALRRHGPPSPLEREVPRGSAVTDVLWLETSARADAFAAALGDGVVRPEHVLLALVWQPRHRWFEDMLASAGTTREAVVAGLAERGVTVPAVAPPGLPPPMTQAATFPRTRLQQLNWALRERAPDFTWGIGEGRDDPETMFVVAAAHIDLSTVLDDVVGSAAWRWRRDVPGL